LGPSLPDLKNGEYEISVSHAEYVSPKPKLELITQKRRDFNFTLRKRLTLTGIVYDTDGKTPVFEASVLVEKPGGGQETLKTNSQGEFTASELYLNETYTFKAFKGTRSVKQEVRLKTGQSTIPLILEEGEKTKPDLKLKETIQGRTDVTGNQP
jgi:hypothetical protein